MAGAADVALGNEGAQEAQPATAMHSTAALIQRRVQGQRPVAQCVFIALPHSAQ